MRMKFRVMFALLCLAGTACGQEPLTNESVIKMVKAGLSEEVVTSMVKTQPGKYSTTVDNLLALKDAGVGDKILAAMVAKAAGGGKESTAGPAETSGTAAYKPAMEIGVYYKVAGEWAEVLPEVVNWKTGGTLKNIASAGVVKKDLNGNIVGPKSRNSVSRPLEFRIIAPEGVAITEYQLIRLRGNKDYREFRTVTGGIFNQQSGAMRDMVPFEGKKLAPRTYSVVLPNNLGAGDYGFLSPGAVGSTGNTQAQIGKMYTFRIVE